MQIKNCIRHEDPSQETPVRTPPLSSACRSEALKKQEWLVLSGWYMQQIETSCSDPIQMKVVRSVASNFSLANTLFPKFLPWDWYAALHYCDAYTASKDHAPSFVRRVLILKIFFRHGQGLPYLSPPFRKARAKDQMNRWTVYLGPSYVSSDWNCEKIKYLRIAGLLIRYISSGTSLPKNQLFFVIYAK